MYSQYEEERWILDHFGKVQGTAFLDIGAYDGKTFSNTLALVELGWGGLCVEPAPGAAKALAELHRENQLVDVLNVAVGTSKQLVKFYDSGGDAVSTTNEAHRALWAERGNVPFSPLYVQQYTVLNIFEIFGWQWDFINVDVEGTNKEVFQSLPLNKLIYTSALCVEWAGDMQNKCGMMSYAEGYGFTLVQENAENLFFVRR